jgi:hypothetical protein
LPQARRHGRDVQGFQPVPARRVDQSLRLLQGQGFYLFPAQPERSYGLRDVAGDEAVARRLLERLAERRVDVLHRPRRKAGVQLLAVQRPEVGGGEGPELDLAQRRRDVVAHLPVVAVVGGGPHAAPDGVRQPVAQVLPQPQVLRLEARAAALPVGERLRELHRHLCSRLAVEGLALAPLSRVDRILGAPAPVLAPVDRPLAVAPLLLGHHRPPSLGRGAGLRGPQRRCRNDETPLEKRGPKRLLSAESPIVPLRAGVAP